MKKAEFKKIIKEIVQEELYTVLPEILREVLQGMKPIQLARPKRKIVENKQSLSREQIAKYIGYDLNDFNTLAQAVDTPAVITSPASNVITANSTVPLQDITGTEVSEDELPPFLVKALNKNYRKLLNEVDKKVDERRP